MLDAALRRPEAQVVAAALDLRALGQRFGDAVPGLWTAVVRRAAPPAVRGGWADGLRAMSPTERPSRLLRTVQAEIAAVLGLADADDVLPDRGLRELGVDSLLAVELRNALSRLVGERLPATLAFDHPTADAITQHLLELADLVDDTTEEAPAPQAAVGEAAVAIVGMACRFPGGANSPEQFWELLRDGVDAIGDVPPERWDVDDWYDPEPGTPDRTYVRQGGFIDDVAGFDADFFGMSATEATTLDPQQRLLLEVTWEALERAGQPVTALRGSRTGVYVGIAPGDYGLRAVAAESRGEDPYGVSSSDTAFAAGRISYLLGLRGPALSVNTACSSSLVAVHQAAAALRLGECTLAVAGGVNAMVTPFATIELSQIRALAPDARCRTFDASADGYVRSEGCGMVAMRPLSDAQRDGDDILAVIRGSAVNHDGASSGLTVPSGPAQQEVMRAALAVAGVDPAAVDYLECHGTGTVLGDPIEVRAAGTVYGQGRDPARSLWLGSVKTNLGHLESGAGVAGLMKLVLALRHDHIPPHLHVREVNPELPLDAFPVAIATEGVPWPRSETPRLGAVSAFGLSGTNAHVIVQEGPARPKQARPVRPAELVVVSGRSLAAARDAAAALAATCRGDLADAALRDIAWSTVATRSLHPHRIAVAAPTVAALAEGLEAAAAREAHPAVALREGGARTGRVAWLFTGGGAQKLGMGRALYEARPVFREALDEVFAALAPHLDQPLPDVMWGDDEALLDHMSFMQPALFAMSLGLVALWRSWGVTPDGLAGHSTGEIAAAHVAGVLSLADAAELVAVRGRLMGALPAGGGMVAIGAPEDEVAAAIAGRDDLSIAAVNGLRSVVISGVEAAALAVAREFAGRGARTRQLRVNQASHSPLMEPMLAPYREVVERVTLAAPTVPLFTALRDGDPTTVDHWVRHVRETVHFADAVRALAEAGAGTFVELGPGSTLVRMVPGCLPDDDPHLVTTLHADLPEAQGALRGLGQAVAAGLDVAWEALHPDGGAQVALPTTSWQHSQHWIARARTAASVDDLLYTVRWVPREVPLATGTPGTWVVRGDDAVAQALTTQLRGAGAKVLDAYDPDVAVRGVVYLGALAASTDDLEQARICCVVEPMELAQRLGPTRVWWVTRHAQAVGDHAIATAQGMLWGFGRALALEQPTSQSTLVDLDDQPADRAAGALMRLLLGDVPEHQLALRGDLTYGARLVRAALPAPSGERVRPDRSYLVVGGLGALGQVTARWLVDRGARHLALMGRSAGTDDARAEVEALRAGGVQIELIRGDVSEEDDVRRAFSHIDAEMPPLAGVLHTAGVLEDNLLRNQTAAGCHVVLRPKVDGGWNLHRATASRELDWFVLFSSVAGLLGGLGVSNYAAANTFLDALAAHRRARGLPGSSLAWGHWEGLGMAIRLADAYQTTHLEGGMRPLRVPSALAAMERALGGPPLVGIVNQDWRQWRGAPFMAELAPAVATAAPEAAAPEGTSELDRLLDAAPRAQWREVLVTFVQDTSERLLATRVGEELNPLVPLWEQGMDSMTCIELRNEITRAGVRLSLWRMIGGPSIDEVAGMMLGELAERRGGAPVPAPADRTEGPEPDALDPVRTHIAAALGGALAGGALTMIVWQLIRAFGLFR